MPDDRVVTVRFLGGAEGIGASCALLTIDGTRLLIDCGVRVQGPLAERLPDLARVEEGGPPAAVLVTHAHLDHIGALPVLLQRYPSVPVYATPPTIALMRIQLLDALKIMESDRQAEGEVPLYSRAAVEALLQRTVPVKPYTRFEPIPGGPRATFFLAGHILGAVAIGIEGRAGRVLFTGDVSTSNQRTIPGMTAPRFRPELVVSESTYGSKLHAARASEEERLVQMIGETIERHGKVLVPAFAIGRAQEVILILIQAMLTKRLPPFPVHVDGLVRNVCQVYRDFAAYLQPRLKRRVERFGDPFFDVLDNVRPVAGERRRLEILEGPACAIVASSGMLTGGASPVYARVLVHGPENLIAITGYQDEESPGRRLLEAADGGAATILLDGREVAVRCRVAKYALSAHADGSQIAGLITALGPADTLLVHGSPEARRELAEVLLRERNGRIHLPREGADYGYVLGGAADLPGAHLRATGVGVGPLDPTALRRHVLQTYREGASFTLADLHRIWHGREPSPAEAEALEREVSSSPCFAPDSRRPFHFTANEAEAAPSGALREDEVLRRVDAAVPPEARLLRKSYTPGLPHLELHFAFPDRLPAETRAALDAALLGTAWTYAVHPFPNAAALSQLISERVPDPRLLARPPSVRMDERAATLWLSREPAGEEVQAWEAAGKAILEASGFQVIVRVRPGTPHPREARDAGGRMEVNLAFRRIAEAFQSAPHRPSRVGLHPGPDETALIRVSFISPQVGERYRETLEGLQAETGWRLQVSPVADQHAISEEARRLLSPLGRIRRGPRFLGRERAVAVEVDAAEARSEELAAEFQARTGYELRLTFKPALKR